MQIISTPDWQKSTRSSGTGDDSATCVEAAPVKVVRDVRGVSWVL